MPPDARPLLDHLSWEPARVIMANGQPSELLVPLAVPGALLGLSVRPKKVELVQRPLRLDADICDFLIDDSHPIPLLRAPGPSTLAATACLPPDALAADLVQRLRQALRPAPLTLRVSAGTAERALSALASLVAQSHVALVAASPFRGANTTQLATNDPATLRLAARLVAALAPTGWMLRRGIDSALVLEPRTLAGRSAPWPLSAHERARMLTAIEDTIARATATTPRARRRRLRAP